MSLQVSSRSVIPSAPKAVRQLRQVVLSAAVNAGRLLQAHEVVNEEGFHVRVAFQLRQDLEGLGLQTAMLVSNGGAPEGGVLQAGIPTAPQNHQRPAQLGPVGAGVCQPGFQLSVRGIADLRRRSLICLKRR